MNQTVCSVPRRALYALLKSSSRWSRRLSTATCAGPAERIKVQTLRSKKSPSSHIRWNTAIRKTAILQLCQRFICGSQLKANFALESRTKPGWGLREISEFGSRQQLGRKLRARSGREQDYQDQDHARMPDRQIQRCTPFCTNVYANASSDATHSSGSGEDPNGTYSSSARTPAAARGLLIFQIRTNGIPQLFAHVLETIPFGRARAAAAEVSDDHFSLVVRLFIRADENNCSENFHVSYVFIAFTSVLTEATLAEADAAAEDPDFVEAESHSHLRPECSAILASSPVTLLILIAIPLLITAPVSCLISASLLLLGFALRLACNFDINHNSDLYKMETNVDLLVITPEQCLPGPLWSLTTVASP
ncbi:hypothetical protein EVAR_18801_1 [Eumeta japonica]|uniref:Uncharacterized protein n=1 Tax=Eumeta variegata TaxID=151549 RepID=A0A4C1ULK3_EUMVA|nr:hypothetical protein EVAR_18801_1 [Eumeta japonica]